MAPWCVVSDHLFRKQLSGQCYSITGVIYHAGSRYWIFELELFGMPGLYSRSAVPLPKLAMFNSQSQHGTQNASDLAVNASGRWHEGTQSTDKSGCVWAHVSRVVNDCPVFLEVWAALVLLPAVQVVHRAIPFLHLRDLPCCYCHTKQNNQFHKYTKEPEPTWTIANKVQ